MRENEQRARWVPARRSGVEVDLAVTARIQKKTRSSARRDTNPLADAARARARSNDCTEVQHRRGRFSMSRMSSMMLMSMIIRDK